MAVLSAIDHPLLNESVIRIFNKNGIHNVLDFLQEDIEHLINVSKYSYKEIIAIRHCIIEKWKAPKLSGSVYCKKIKQFSTFITTGIPSLDAVLEDGLPIGKIVEVCGFPASGKTQLAFTIATNVSSILKYNVVYIDTKGDFSGTRIHEILKESGCNDQMIGVCMERIKVIEIWNINELINLLHEFRRNEKMCKMVHVIIVDSLPSLVLQHQGEKTKESLGLLNQFVNVARCIGEKYQISFIVVNLITRWSEMPVIEPEDESNAALWIENRSTLGKYWQHIPNMFLKLELKSEGPNKKIEIGVRKSYDTNSYMTISLNLTSKGIT